MRTRLLGFGTIVFWMAGSALAGSIFVNGTSGNDSWDGRCETWDGANCGPKKTIQAGIDTAVAGETVLVADGTYTGAGNKNLDFLGKAITVKSSSGAAACIINCGGDGRGFSFHSGETGGSILDGFTITGGRFELGAGAGILCSSSPVIRNCVIADNHIGTLYMWGGGDGGGVCCTGGSPVFENCTIAGNSADNTFPMGGAHGGGMYFDGGSAATVCNCTVSGNYCSGDNFALGGAIYVNGADLTIENCVITKNAVGTPDDFSALGGGICYSDGTLRVVNSLIALNGAGRGGGVAANTWASPGVAELVNCTVADNTAWGRTGGLLLASDGSSMISNCIVWGNSPNEFEGPVTFSYCDVKGGVGGIGNINLDPHFVDTANGNYRLGGGSPCVDAGSNAVVSPDEFDLDGDGNYTEPLPFDLDGNPRFFDEPNVPDTGSGTPPIVDMGAYEKGLPPVHNVIRDKYYDTIQDGIDAASTGDVLVLSPVTYRGNRNCDLDFGGKAITLRSTDPFAPTIVDATVIDCQGSAADPHRGFHFHSGEGPDSVVAGVTIANGYGPEDLLEGAGEYFVGGALLCDSASPTIDHCVITGNKAEKGGAVCCLRGSNPRLENCTIASNDAIGTAAAAGGAYCRTDCRPIIVFCDIHDNRSEASGGGVVCNNASHALIVNCKVTNNHAVGTGGGIFCSATSSPTIANCLLANNEAAAGGAIYCNSSTCDPLVADCTIAGNNGGVGGGAIYCRSAGSPTVANSILWADLPDEISAESGEPIVVYSDVQGGWPGAGNFSADPRFVNPSGADYRLSRASPCIDGGDNALLPPDTADLDGDGLMDEPIPLDLDLKSRRADDPYTHDHGHGAAPLVDMGAYEFQPEACNPCDTNCDGSVNGFDIQNFVGLLSGTGTPCSPCAGDTNADGSVNGFDIQGFVECLKAP